MASSSTRMNCRRPGRARPLRLAWPAVAALLLLGCAAASVQQAGSVDINYPPADSNDWFNLRACPVTWSHEISCYLIGTRGPVRKISWMDDRLKVLDGYIEFDR